MKHLRIRTIKNTLNHSQIRQQLKPRGKLHGDAKFVAIYTKEKYFLPTLYALFANMAR